MLGQRRALWPTIKPVWKRIQVMIAYNTGSCHILIGNQYVYIVISITDQSKVNVCTEQRLAECGGNINGFRGYYRILTNTN